MLTPSQHPPRGGAIPRASAPPDREPPSDAQRDPLHQPQVGPLLPGAGVAFVLGCLTGHALVVRPTPLAGSVTGSTSVTIASAILTFACVLLALIVATRSRPEAANTNAVSTTRTNARNAGGRVTDCDRASAGFARLILCAGVWSAGIGWSVSSRCEYRADRGWCLPAADAVLIPTREGPILEIPPNGVLVSITGVCRGDARTVPLGSDLTADLAHTTPQREVVLDAVQFGNENVLRGLANPISVAGKLIMRVPAEQFPSGAAILADGSRIKATGWLRGRGGRLNPRPSLGADERVELVPARDDITVGWLTVPESQLVLPEPDNEGVLAGLASIRRAARSTVARSLASAQPTWSNGQSWNLLESMLLGDDSAGGRFGEVAGAGVGGRPPDDFGVDIEQTFAAAGLTHLIAISGFNLAILAGSVAAFTNLFRLPRLVGESVSIVLVAAYALLVEPQASVMRAAVCALAASLCVVLGRRWNSGSALAAAAILILLVDPSEVMRPGFQLTFVAVIALRHLGPPLHERWYGDRAPPETLTQYLGHAMRSMLTTTVAVWLVTTPIAVWHFGRIAPLAVPLSLLAIPVGSLLLVAGYATMACSLVSSALAAPLAALAAILAHALLWLARVGSGVGEGLSDLIAPSSSLSPLTTFSASWLWCILAALIGVWWCRCDQGRKARQARCVLLAAWLLPIGLTYARELTAPEPHFRIIMLAVGDGSAFLVRSGAFNVIVDAGSSSSTSIAAQVVLPALASEGVRHLNAVIITHPDLDHYSAVPTLLEAGMVDELIVTDVFTGAAESNPGGGPGRILASAARARTIVTTCHRGTTRTFGSTRWTWLHPPTGFRAPKDNDTSQVIRVENIVKGAPVSPNGRPIRMLFTGDIEARGALSLRDAEDLRADVCELPHHGAWQEAVVPLMLRTSSRLILQSTARARFERDRWRSVWPELGLPLRHVTCRDGALRIDVAPSGVIRLERWRSPSSSRGGAGGWTPCGLLGQDEQYVSGSSATHSATPITTSIDTRSDLPRDLRPSFNARMKSGEGSGQSSSKPASQRRSESSANSGQSSSRSRRSSPTSHPGRPRSQGWAFLSVSPDRLSRAEPRLPCEVRWRPESGPIRLRSIRSRAPPSKWGRESGWARPR
jgi:ComEC/Rec2-related protein